MKRIVMLSYFVVSLSAFAGAIPDWGFFAGTPGRALVSSNGGTCANFSGKWKGTCTGVPAEEMEIEQIGCEIIVTDTEVHYIGGTENLNYAFPLQQGAVSTHVSLGLNWNSDKTQLLFDGGIRAQVLTSNKITKADFDGSMRLSGSQLISEFHGGGKTYACVYDKE